MNTLTKELVSKDSPKWIGFQHAVLSGISLSVFSLCLSLTYPDIFGFYFASPAQEFWDVAASTLLGTVFSAVILFTLCKRAEKNPRGTLNASIGWSCILTLLLFAVLFLTAGPALHYGVSDFDATISAVPLGVTSVLLFSLTSWFFLRRRGDTIKK